MGSSIHIENASADALVHNERIFDIDHAIDSEERNEYLTLANTAATAKAARLDFELTPRIDKNGKEVFRKMPKNAEIIKEAIINLEERHTMSDLAPVIDRLQEMGYKVTHVAIHKDEGHINDDGSKSYNYHAHLMLINYDFEKHRTVRPGHAEMRQMQTDIANALQMERGKEFINPKTAHPDQLARYQENPEAFTTTKTKRLETWDYKRAMELKDEGSAALIERIVELEAENKQLKSELYDYKQMKQFIANLPFSAEERKSLHNLNGAINKMKSEAERAKNIDALHNKITALESRSDVVQKAVNKIAKDLEVVKPEDPVEYQASVILPSIERKIERITGERDEAQKDLGALVADIKNDTPPAELKATARKLDLVYSRKPAYKTAVERRDEAYQSRIRPAKKEEPTPPAQPEAPQPRQRIRLATEAERNPTPPDHSEYFKQREAQRAAEETAYREKMGLPADPKDDPKPKYTGPKQKLT